MTLRSADAQDIISPTGGSIGLGFSIPADLATGVVDQLREFGETRRGWLGVRIQPVTDDIAESLGMVKAEGALIAGVIITPMIGEKVNLDDPGQVFSNWWEGVE